MCSSWSLRKGIGEGEVTSEDREHAKRIVYSVVYGAGEYKHTHTYTLAVQWVLIDSNEKTNIQSTGQLTCIV